MSTALINIVGPRVRAIRQERGWSQAILAAKCQIAGLDITRDIVANIELRRRWVLDAELPILAKVLRVRIIDLFPRNVRPSEEQALIPKTS